MAFHPDLERFEAKQLLSAGASAAHGVHLEDGSGASTVTRPRRRRLTGRRRHVRQAVVSADPVPRVPHHQPDLSARPPGPALPAGPGPAHPAGPGPGLQRALRRREERDGARRSRPPTTSRSGSRAPPGRTACVGNAFPVLTGNQVWKPKTWIVFYALSKKYYPLSPQVVRGFPARRRRPVVDARAGAVGDLPAAHRMIPPSSPGPSTGSWPMARARNGRRREAGPARHGHQHRSSRRRPTGTISPATSDRLATASSGGRGRPVAHRGQERRPRQVHRPDLAGRMPQRRDSWAG